LYAESTASGEDTYILHVEQIECDASHLQMQNIVTGRVPAVIMIAHDQMVAFQDSKVVKFPDLELVPGQQREIDQQNPVMFSTRGVGMKISATISGVTNCIIPNISTGINRTNTCVSLRYFFENVIGPLSTNETETIKTANPKLKDEKGPGFHSKNMHGDITLTLGQWIVLGGLPMGESRYMTCFVKVEK
ncbi:MAG TPA: hypothetical protein VJC18_09095, partial [bacterium]|nr:hypothetical protein [bacterium]